MLQQNKAEMRKLTLQFFHSGCDVSATAPFNKRRLRPPHGATAHAPLHVSTYTYYFPSRPGVLIIIIIIVSQNNNTQKERPLLRMGDIRAKII